ncbi:MAG: hypothetical protein AB1767_00010 [Bacillota bacterium]
MSQSNTECEAPLLGLPPAELEQKLSQPWVKEGLYVPLAMLAPAQEELIPQLLQIEGI